MDKIEITTEADALLLALRVLLGIVFLAHGFNHLWGPGGLAGTARWFASLGFRPARLHALMSGVVELTIGVCLLAGALTALVCAAVVGTMLVAGWTDHRPNGFFMFRNGYEYVLMLGGTAIVLAGLGPGSFSFDQAAGIVDSANGQPTGLEGLGAALLAASLGALSGTFLLALGWRRPAGNAPAESLLG